MYAIIVHYLRPLEDIDKHLQAHRAWLREQYSKKHFFVSGAQDPRDKGGFILADDMPIEQLTQIIAADPFATNEVARHEIIKVRPTMADSRLQQVFIPG